MLIKDVPNNTMVIVKSCDYKFLICVSGLHIIYYDHYLGWENNSFADALVGADSNFPWKANEHLSKGGIESFESCDCLYGWNVPASTEVEIVSVQPQLSIPKYDTYICRGCHIHNQYAISDQNDNTYICFSCRSMGRK